MRLAVVIATRDRPHLLGPCLESVRNQSLAAAQVIVVDDGDNSETSAICRGILPDAILVRSGRAGIAVANNLGLDFVEADAVVPQGDDDIMLPNRLADHARVLATGAGVAYSGWINFTQPANRLEFVTAHPAPTLPTLLGESTVIGQGAAAYRSDIILRHRYDSRLSIGCDMDLNARLLEAGTTFVHSNTFTMLRRLHAGSVTSRFADVQRALKEQLRQRFGHPLAATTSARPLDVAGGRRVAIDWPTTAKALARIGIDIATLRFGRLVTTLDEIAHFVTPMGKFDEFSLTPYSTGSIGGAIVSVGDMARIASLAYRERLVAAPVPPTTAGQRSAASIAEVGPSLGLLVDGSRLLIDLAGLGPTEIARLAAGLAQISPSWRLTCSHPVVDMSFGRSVSVAATSGRFSSLARMQQAAGVAIETVASICGIDFGEAVSRIRAVQRANDRVFAVEPHAR